MPAETSLNLIFIFMLFFFLLLNFAVGAAHYSRHDFPADFVFGSSTSAYQVEGAANEDGRTPSIYDTSAHFEAENDDVACDGYHKYKEDVQLMVETGLEAYRFSISWSRLIPNGKGPVNPKGVQYYNNLINELISKGIQPHATLNHHDLPQALEDEYEGWLSRDVIRDFTNYADVCFREFGDRVKYWTTVNEVNVFAVGGYDLGITPPQRCSPPFCATNSTKGNSTYEPYLVTHHILLSHASAVTLYRKKYRDEQHGFVGVSICSFGFIPITNTEKDRAATQRARDFFVGWIIEPLMNGDYPISMKTNAGDRIPTFTDRESEHVKGAYDFIALNHYININIKDNSDALNEKLRDHAADMAAWQVDMERAFTQEELPVAPWGLKEELNAFKLLYGNPPIFIYENGQRTKSNSSLEDVSRVEYLHGYIGAVLDAFRNGSNVKGYFAWSFLDLYELFNNYKTVYGLYYVDRNDPELKRYPKLSAKWYGEFLRGRSTSTIGTIELDKDPSLVSVGHFLQ